MVICKLLSAKYKLLGFMQAFVRMNVIESPASTKPVSERNKSIYRLLAGVQLASDEAEPD